ncbi:uncharacterized protein METZ01_LOCUS332255, partial [marine metagenome]
VEVHISVFLAASQCLWPHASLADHSAHPEFFHDVRLIGLFAYRSGRSRCCDLPISIVVLQHYGPTVIYNSAFKTYSFGQIAALMQIFVDCIPPGE